MTTPTCFFFYINYVRLIKQRKLKISQPLSRMIHMYTCIQQQMTYAMCKEILLSFFFSVDII